MFLSTRGGGRARGFGTYLLLHVTDGVVAVSAHAGVAS